VEAERREEAEIARAAREHAGPRSIGSAVKALEDADEAVVGKRAECDALGF
jgi:hypothetical protein